MRRIRLMNVAVARAACPQKSASAAIHPTAKWNNKNGYQNNQYRVHQKKSFSAAADRFHFFRSSFFL
jgi:hypothetical protein